MESDITKWYANLPYDERKSLLCDLHTARATARLKVLPILIELISQLEEVHDQVKKERGYTNANS
jgi:hypothetical protein